MNGDDTNIIDSDRQTTESPEIRQNGIMHLIVVVELTIEVKVMHLLL